MKARRRRVAFGCLFTVGLFIFLGLGRYMYIRVPRFTGSTPVAIQITMYSPDELQTNAVIQATITNELAAQSLLRFLRSARVRLLDHKCADVGSFTIRYQNSKVDALAFLPGHDMNRYEFRFGGGLYLLPRLQFYQVLRDVGVDTAKMPETEH